MGTFKTKSKELDRKTDAWMKVEKTVETTGFQSRATHIHTCLSNVTMLLASLMTRLLKRLTRLGHLDWILNDAGVQIVSYCYALVPLCR